MIHIHLTLACFVFEQPRTRLTFSNSQEQLIVMWDTLVQSRHKLSQVGPELPKALPVNTRNWVCLWTFSLSVPMHRRQLSYTQDAFDEKNARAS